MANNNVRTFVKHRAGSVKDAVDSIPFFLELRENIIIPLFTSPMKMRYLIVNGQIGGFQPKQSGNLQHKEIILMLSLHGEMIQRS